jgi:hypothetical protein
MPGRESVPFLALPGFATWGGLSRPDPFWSARTFAFVIDGRPSRPIGVALRRITYAVLDASII